MVYSMRSKFELWVKVLKVNFEIVWEFWVLKMNVLDYDELTNDWGILNWLKIVRKLIRNIQLTCLRYTYSFINGGGEE